MKHYHYNAGQLRGYAWLLSLIFNQVRMHPPMIVNLKKDLTIVVFYPEEKDISKPF